MLQLLVLVIAHHLIVTFAKNNFLILGECPIYGINGSFGSSERKITINVSKENTKFCLSLHYNANNSYLLVNGK